MLLPALSQAEQNKVHWRIIKSIEIGEGVYSTDDWNSFTRIPDTDTPQFEFQTPPEWKLKGTVFSNNEGIKIAELMPGGLVKLNDNQQCFDGYNEEYSEYSILRDKKLVLIGELNVHVQLLESEYSDGAGNFGTWYPQVFCVSKDGYAFMMTFYKTRYSAEVGHVSQEILSSLKFISKGDYNPVK